MTRTRWLEMSLALLAAGLIAVGCGDDDEGDTTPTAGLTGDRGATGGAGEDSGAVAADCLMTEDEASSILGGPAKPVDLGVDLPPGGDVTLCSFEVSGGATLGVSSFSGIDEAYYEANVKTTLADQTQPVEGIGDVADYGISGQGVFRTGIIGFLRGDTGVTISCIDCGSDAQVEQLTREAAEVVVGKL